VIIKYPVVFDALKLSCLKPSETQDCESFGIYENLFVDEEMEFPSDLIMKINNLVWKIQKS